MSRIFWDTMLFIYWLEDNPRFGPRVQEIWLRMNERGDQLCTSSLAVGETLTGFYKRAAPEAANDVGNFFREGSIEIIPYTVDMVDLYAELRAKYGVSSADGIHLACAASVATDLFLTNDNDLIGKSVPGIQFIASLDARMF